MTSDTFQTLLYSVGVFQHYFGYAYLQEAVVLAAEKPERLHSIRKEIYFPVAKKHHTNVHNVEKDIRTVRDILIRNGGTDLLTELTGFDSWDGKRLYPKELIGILAAVTQEAAVL